MKVRDLPVSTATMLLLSVSNLVVFVSFRFLVWRGLVKDDHVPGKRLNGVQLTAGSILHLSGELVWVSLVLLAAWLCENMPFWEHDSKKQLEDMFWFLCLAVVWVAFATKEPSKSKDLVNREQSEEWKGWMQTIFLLYHYYEVTEVYNIVRVLISCYVWMTGFGNFSFFYVKQDFGFVRFAQMMWRLNFSVALLCMTMNNMYMLYYICPLHTFYFLLVYAVMRIGSHLNHTKNAIRIKLGVVGILIYLVWEFEALFNLVFFFLPNYPNPGAAVGAFGIKYEWHFRSGLDHYAALFGMVFALNFPMAHAWIEKVEKLPAVEMWLVKSFVGFVLLSLSAWWVMNILSLPKLDFNAHNPYTFFIPLLTYLFFRNLTPELRSIHLGLLATMGKYTLETYLMQHHVWLTSNAKTRLVIIPEHPFLNFFFVSVLYFILSRRLYRVTMSTRALLIPDDTNRAMTNLGVVAAVFGIFGFISSFFHVMRVGSQVYLLAGALIGSLVFLWLLKNLSSTGPLSESYAQSTVSPTRALTYLLVGLFLALFGVQILPNAVSAITPVNARVNAGPLRPVIPSLQQRGCLRNLASGAWVSAHRIECSQNTALCKGQSWSWTEVVQRQCGVKHISQLEAVSLFSNKHVAFIGDETVYDLAVAVHRTIDPSVGHVLLGLGSEKTLDIYQLKMATDDGETNFGNLSIQVVSSIRGIIAALKDVNLQGASLFVVGAWTGNLDTPPAAYAKHLAELDLALKGKECVLVLPPMIVDSLVNREWVKNGLTESTVQQLRQVLLSSELAERCSFTVDLHTLTDSFHGQETLDGARYSLTANAVASQVFFNGIKLTEPADDSTNLSKAKEKGKGGGIAMSPTLGMLTLCVLACMLYFGDIYAGISFIALKNIPHSPQEVTWEESTKELHSKLGLPHGLNQINGETTKKPHDHAI